MQRKQQYRKGADYERKIVKGAREDGKLAFRSAGSHSPIDVCVIDSKKRTITLIQAKAGKSLGASARQKLVEKYKFLNGTYEIEFKVQ